MANGKDMMMLGKEHTSGTSKVGKKFGKAKVSVKPFGFGKRIKQGMKRNAVGYGSA